MIKCKSCASRFTVWNLSSTHSFIVCFFLLIFVYSTTMLQWFIEILAPMRASMLFTYYIELFRTGADRHNGILMSLFFLVAETIKVVNWKRAKTVVLKTWEYNTSYIPVCTIVPLVVLYMRVSGKFPNLYLFLWRNFTRKISIKCKQATFRYFMHIKTIKSNFYSHILYA